jgi:hypothetical protein
VLVLHRELLVMVSLDRRDAPACASVLLSALFFPRPRSAGEPAGEEAAARDQQTEGDSAAEGGGAEGGGVFVFTESDASDELTLLMPLAAALLFPPETARVCPEQWQAIQLSGSGMEAECGNVAAVTSPLAARGISVLAYTSGTCNLLLVEHGRLDEAAAAVAGVWCADRCG